SGASGRLLVRGGYQVVHPAIPSPIDPAELLAAVHFKEIKQFSVFLCFCISVFLWLLTHKSCPRRFRHHFSCLHIAATVSFGRLKRKATGKRKGGRCPAELASSKASP